MLRNRCAEGRGTFTLEQVPPVLRPRGVEVKWWWGGGDPSRSNSMSQGPTERMTPWENSKQFCLVGCIKT